MKPIIISIENDIQTIHPQKFKYSVIGDYIYVKLKRKHFHVLHKFLTTGDLNKMYDVYLKNFEKDFWLQDFQHGYMSNKNYTIKLIFKYNR